MKIQAIAVIMIVLAVAKAITAEEPEPRSDVERAQYLETGGELSWKRSTNRSRERT